MDDLISREAAKDAIRRKFPILADRSEINEVLNGLPTARSFYAGRESMNIVKTSDRVDVVRCKDCVFWQKPQVRLPDGTRRDYLPDEIDPLLGISGVTSDVGINVGSYCNAYWTDDYVEDGCHEWKNEHDFCSRGARRDENETSND